MSAAAGTQGAVVQSGPPPQAVEGCPLCGTPLRGEQEWCLRCGAAARTRLASTPNWRTPLIVLGLAIVLGLGALTASLVALAGGPKTAPASTITRTVTAGASGTTAPGAPVPGAGAPGTTTPGAGTPGTTTPSTSTPGASTPGVTPPATATSTTPGAATPSTPTGTGTTSAKGATIPGTHIKIPGASAREAGKILDLLSPHAQR